MSIFFKSALARKHDAVLRSVNRGDGTWMNLVSWEEIIPKAGEQVEGCRTFQGYPVWIDNTLPDQVWEIRKRTRKGFKVLYRLRAVP